MIRQVYIGATEYAAGDFVALEREIDDGLICAQLRDPAHGADTFPQYQSDILELAQRSVQKTLAASALQTSDIDAVFLVSNMLDGQDNLELGWLGEMNRRMGLSHAVHYQIGMAGCAGFHWAARLAASLIAADQCNNILLLSFDQAGGKLLRLYGAGTDFPYVTGDAAASCIFSSSPARMDYQLLGKIVHVYDSQQIAQPSLDSEMRSISQLFKKTCASAGVAARELDFFVTNNYSYNASQLYARLANISYSKTFVGTIASHAHCFGCDNIINLHHLHAAGELHEGKRLLLFSTGPLQWGACVLQKISSTAGQ